MRMKLIVAAVGAVCLICPAIAAADFLGLYVGAGAWNVDFSGDVLNSVDVDRQLGISSDTSYDIYVAFEHPIPFVPNIRLARAGIKDSGKGTVTTAFDFDGTAFAPNDEVGSNLDLTYTDLTLYYEIWDTGFDFDLGLTARKFDGELTINTTTQSIDAYLPMVYVNARVNLPFSGFYLGATGNGLTFRDSSLTDYAVKLGWSTESFIFPEFGIEGGYRRFDLNADANDADVDVDVELSGPFINLVAHF